MTTFLAYHMKPNVVDRVSAFDTLPASALMDVSEVSALASRSPASIWRDVDAGRLAQPRKIGPGATRWTADDVRQYLKGGA